MPLKMNWRYLQYDRNMMGKELSSLLTGDGWGGGSSEAEGGRAE